MAEYTASSASYTDVNYTVNTEASAGDTVYIPAGTETWSSTLVINKGVNLIGDGYGNTVITVGGSTGILYAPTAANAAYDYPFRLSSIGMNLNGHRGIGFCSSYKYGMCESSGYMGAIKQTKIRIDNNNFVGSGDTTAIEVAGAFRGVVYENIFNGATQRHWGTGDGEPDWDAWGPYIYGTADSMYYEDNVFTNVGGYMISDGDQGGRYVYRYNTFSLGGHLQPMWDFHGGNSGNGIWSCFGGEIYGNSVSRNGYTCYLAGHRGGKLLIFCNSLDSAAGAGMPSVYVDGEGCPPANHYNDQLIQDVYSWTNRRGPTGSLILMYEGYDGCGYLSGTENERWWKDDTSFDGSVGIGYGPLSSRPSTCTEGVGYWATDQDMDDLSDYVGANPTTPLSGTLYVGAAGDTWDTFYTPYTYPHPLRDVEPEPGPGTGPGGHLVLIM